MPCHECGRPVEYPGPEFKLDEYCRPCGESLAANAQKEAAVELWIKPTWKRVLFFPVLIYRHYNQMRTGTASRTEALSFAIKFAGLGLNIERGGYGNRKLRSRSEG